MNPFVTLSPRADEELELVLAYLNDNFSTDSALKCLDNVETVCWQIAAFPFAFPAYKGKSNQKSGGKPLFINVLSSEKDTIEVLPFWDNRMNPNDTNI